MNRFKQVLYKFFGSNTGIYLLGLSFISFHLVLLIYLKFTAWPEMLAWPYLVINNLSIYKDIAIAHTPGLVLILSVVYRLFGIGILQLKIFTWVLIVITDIGIFFVTKKLWNRKTALLSLISYIFFQLFYDGNGLWFDSFVTLTGLGTFYLFAKRKYFWCGALLGISILGKQTSIWFLIPIFWEMFFIQKGRKKIIINFVLGGLSVVTLSLIVFYFAEILNDFLKWAIGFGVLTLPRSSGQIQMPGIKSLIVSSFPFIVFLPLLIIKGRKIHGLIFWSLAGALGAFPRFELFHFQPALPFLAIACGIVFTKLIKKGILRIALMIYILGMAYLFLGFFIRNFGEGVRFYENDVKVLVDSIRKNTNRGDRIFVMNWWDNIYALSDRLPAVDPLVPQLWWYQNLPGIQEKEVKDIAFFKPKMILIKPYSFTGLDSYIPESVYNYITENYKLEERIEGIDIYINK